MTATPSQSRLLPFWLNARTKLIANRKTLIVYGVLQLLGLPLIALAVVLAGIGSIRYVPTGLGEPEPYWVRYGSMYATLGAFFFCASLLLGFLFATGVFDYLYKKARVDMTYALPINTPQRFFSDFLTGAAMYLIPFLAACGLSFAIFEIGCAVEGGIRDLLSDMLPAPEIVALKCVVMTALGMLFLYACTVFAMTCCGTPSESLTSTACLLFLVPITVAVFCMVYLQGGMYGIDIESALLKLIEYTGPVGAGSIFLLFLEAEAQYPIGSWAAVYLTEILLLVAVTYLLYRHRKAEDTSKPYVYRFMYYFCMTALMVCLFAIAVGQDDSLIPVLILSGVVYLIAEVITNRGFKKFYKSLIRFAVTMGAIAVFTFLLNATDFFGVVNRLPNVSNINSITFTCNENYNTIYWDGSMDALPEVELTEAEQIEAVHALHAQLLDAYASKENHSDGYNPTEIRITYHLKAGTQFTRRYTITAEQWSDLVEPVMKSSAWMQATLDRRIPDKSDEEDIALPGILIDSSDRQTQDRFTPRSYQQFVKDFKTAYMQDWRNMTREEFLEPKQIYLYLSGIPVRSSFTGTVALLRQYGCTPPEPSSSTESSEYADPNGRLYCLGTDHGRIYSNLPIPTDSDDLICSEIPNAYTLLPYATSYGSSTWDYVLAYGGVYYLLSPDSKPLVDQLLTQPPETPDEPQFDASIMLQYDSFDAYVREEGSDLTPKELGDALRFWCLLHA